jgi:hypothetical protein
LALAGLVSPSSHSATVDKQDYYSTFHKAPKQKKFTKKQREDFTRESTHQAVAEWGASPESHQLDHQECCSDSTPSK